MMAHKRGYRVSSVYCCCNCPKKNNKLKENSATVTIIMGISGKCCAAPTVRFSAINGANSVPADSVKVSKDSTDCNAQKIQDNNISHVNDLNQNLQNKSTDEIWKHLVSKHDHERMEREVKKLESRIKNLGKIRPIERSTIIAYKKKNNSNAVPKCAFL